MTQVFLLKMKHVDWLDQIPNRSQYSRINLIVWSLICLVKTAIWENMVVSIYNFTPIISPPYPVTVYSHCWKVIVFPSLSENRAPPNPLVNHKCPYQNPINWGIAHFQTQPNIIYCWLCLPRFFSPFQKNPRHFIIASFQKAGKSVIVFPSCLDFPLPATMGRDGLHLVGHVGGVAANAVEAGNFPLSTGLAPRVGTRPPQTRCLFLTKMNVFQMI